MFIGEIGKMVEIRVCSLWALLKLNFCNFFVSLCKNSLIVDWRDQSLSRVGQVGPNWVNIFWCVCFALLFIFCLWFCVFHFIPRLHLCLLLLLFVVTLILVTTFLSTHHSFIGVILSSNSQHIRGFFLLLRNDAFNIKLKKLSF